MDKQIKQKWVEALRSEEYEQGTEALREDNKYCCLGVLCDLYRKETGKGKWNLQQEKEFMAEFEDGEGETDYLRLTSDVAKWAGLPMSPKIRYNHLSNLNDGGETFSTIADLIDENF